MALLTGIHHLAIVTADLDRFLEFYASVFDAEVVPIDPTPAFRHALVRVGGAAVLHPIEPTAGNAHARGRAAMLDRGHLDHLALAVPNWEALCEVRQRLQARGATDGRIDTLGPMLSLWFEDPDGMRAEVCWSRIPSLRGLHAPRPYRSA